MVKFRQLISSIVTLPRLKSLGSLQKSHSNYTLAASMGAGAVIVGGILGGKEVVNRYRLRGTYTDVDAWDEKQSMEKLVDEVSKFENSGKINPGDEESLFEFDKDEIFGYIDLKVLYLSMKQINSVIERYPNIIAKFKRQLSSKGIKLRITGKPSRPLHSINDGDMVASINFTNGEFAFYHRMLKDLKRARLGTLQQINSAVYPSCDHDKLVEKCAAHEMGHIIQYALTFVSDVNSTTNKFEPCSLWNEKWPTKSDIDPRWAPILGPIVEYNKWNFAGEFMKEHIKECSGDSVGFISKYGETDSKEWFAEVCAHAFCSKEPNALGKAMLQFLAEQDQKLGETFAKIDRA